MTDRYREFLETDPVLSVPDVVVLEQRIAAEGTSLKELMRRVGTATAQVVMDRISVGARVVVLAGTGNNGGDGWVAADVLSHAGYAVTLVTMRSAAELRAEPAAETAKEISGAYAAFETAVASDGADAAWLNGVLHDAAVVLDCILGTGFEGATVREPYATWIDCANAWRAHGESDRPQRFLLAVDAPSGFSAQSGQAANQCIRADATITMIVGKTGLLAEGAEAYTGQLLLAPLV